MLCRSPYINATGPFGCGQCLPCRVNKRRLWTHRMMLESMLHGDSAFVTLTYSPDDLPKGGTLVLKDLQLWLKRLRRAVAPRKLRFFAVGEYGDTSFRPHYHAAIFGLNREEDQVVSSTWGKGSVFLGDLTSDSAAYICGYVTKKMTSKEDKRLCGKLPEFARMSLRPGIGADAMAVVAKSLMSLSHPCSVMNTNLNGDVPTVLSHGKSKYSLGRYLRRRLRLELGYGALDTPKESLQMWTAKMHQLFQDALADPENTYGSLREIIVDGGKQKVLNMEARMRIHSQGGTL